MSLSPGKTAFFLLGLSAGALGSVLIRNPAAEQPAPSAEKQVTAATGAINPASKPPESPTPKADALPQAAESDRLRKALEARNQAVKTMESSLAEMRQTLQADEQEREQRREAMQKRFTQFAQGNLEARMSSLARAANLDDEQYGLVASFLEERTNLMMELRSGRYTEEMSAEREAELRQKLDTMNLGQYLGEILGPEQYAEFDSHRQQRNTVAQEAFASRELSRLVDTVKLSEQQLDQIYSAYYQQATQAVPEGELFDSRRMRQQRGDIEAQTEILADILDTEQLAAYRSVLENNRGGPWRR